MEMTPKRGKNKRNDWECPNCDTPVLEGEPACPECECEMDWDDALENGKD